METFGTETVEEKMVSTIQCHIKAKIGGKLEKGMKKIGYTETIGALLLFKKKKRNCLVWCIAFVGTG